MNRLLYYYSLIFLIIINVLSVIPIAFSQSSPVLRSVPSVSNTPKPQIPAAQAPVTKETAIAPYEKDMQRLSEVMGSLAFLRNLCGAKDASEWVLQMRALLESEGSSSPRRERLVAAYNHGFQGYALTYRRCTPAAELASSLYIKEGESLTRSLASRFGG
jgi:uncharacterized protein (TIGR02301 family)